MTLYHICGDSIEKGNRDKIFKRPERSGRETCVDREAKINLDNIIPQGGLLPDCPGHRKRKVNYDDTIRWESPAERTQVEFPVALGPDLQLEYPCYRKKSEVN